MGRNQIGDEMKQNTTEMVPVSTQKGELVEAAPQSREDLFVSNLGRYRTQREAALASGYSESYARTSISEKWKSEKFLAKVRKYYHRNAVFLLPKIFNIEAMVVDLVLNNPEILPKHRHTLKELKQTAGVLQHIEAAERETINYDELRQVLSALRSEAEQSMTD